MAIDFRTPHTVTLKRPAKATDAETHAGSWNYATPALQTTVKGLYQERVGKELVDSAGEVFNPDSVFFTKTPDVQIADRLEIFGLKLIVVDVAQKYDLDGNYSHTQVAMVRDVIRS